MAVSFFTTEKSLQQQLPSECNLELQDSVVVTDDCWYLENLSDHLTLLGQLEGQTFQLSFDFLAGAMSYRRQHGGGRKEPLAKAIGLKQNATPRVIDATAGMGREAFLLASMGCQVTAYERNPIIYSLLQDARRRLSNDDNSNQLSSRLTVRYGNSIQLLNKLNASNYPEVIYMDPMFPERTKSAAVKKEMRIFKQLAGADSDDAELLQAALVSATGRVVVKRPIKAPFVGNLKPSFQITSKKHRFDVYLIQKDNVGC